uniref:Iron-sulfur cluster formation ABC transporter ATP-binding subunit n=1 Tax=Pseudellipsoidion edaphicum TaxID=1431838 RepID=A0A3R5QSS6_9STRA|nr:iron-sulfur cluster formation ABC transporter ATP-binding subunit [Pseudellipsoidion edaphicum]QAA12024.1 iron-sulfur cluster formation ABC transporter ATP-binding subunit [Pseudellipsoidion edaphicum]
MVVKNYPLFGVKNLIVTSENNQQSKNILLILKGINLTLGLGEIQIIMGPNGSGKSTFAKAIAGHPSYDFIHGSFCFRKKNLLNCYPETRARLGLFLAFQYPIEVNGVSNQDFLRVAYYSRYTKKEEVGLNYKFANKILNYIKILEMDPNFLPRPLNQGFSGGEKKKNEILQMSITNCQLSILDEIDSGLDVDALKALSKTILIYFLNDLFINSYLLTTKSLLLITHYRRLLEYIQPNRIQIMRKGKIACSGNYKLGLIVDKKGYDWLIGVGIGSYLKFLFNEYKIYKIKYVKNKPKKTKTKPLVFL